MYAETELPISLGYRVRSEGQQPYPPFLCLDITDLGPYAAGTPLPAAFTALT
ncbi:hypothetical protein [Streptomyces sp. SD15]